MSLIMLVLADVRAAGARVEAEAVQAVLTEIALEQASIRPLVDASAV